MAVASGAGNTRGFVCPAHAWTYDLTGKLVGVLRGQQIGDFDKAGCRLPQIGIGVHAGFIFINLDPEAVPLLEYLEADGFPETVALFRGDDLITVDQYSFEIDANWKIAIPNMMRR